MKPKTKILTKILSILSIVALCFVCLCSTCGAYWADTGSREYTYIPTPEVYMMRFGSAQDWVSFANTSVASNSGVIEDIMIDGRAFETQTNIFSGSAASGVYVVGPPTNFAERALVTYPTLRLNWNENPNLNKAYSYLYIYTSNAQSKYMTYQVDYTIRWLEVETEYHDKNGDPSQPGNASYVDNKLVPRSYTGKYTTSQALRFFKEDGRFATFTQNDGQATVYLNIPDITTLMQVDSGLRDILGDSAVAVDDFDVDYTITSVFSENLVFQVGSIVEKVNGSFSAYSRYDASASPLASNFTVKTRNPATLFNFIGETFNAVMDINIAGIKLGDILGIGVALSVLLMLLKVFAGG